MKDLWRWWMVDDNSMKDYSMLDGEWWMIIRWWVVNDEWLFDELLFDWWLFDDWWMMDHNYKWWKIWEYADD